MKKRLGSLIRNRMGREITDRYPILNANSNLFILMLMGKI